MIGKQYNVLILLLILGGFWLPFFNYASAQSSPVPIIWQNLVDVISSGNTITKTTPNGWGAGASGASSTQYIPTGYEGYVEFSMTNNAGMAGLSNGDPDADYPSLDYAIQAGPNYGSSVVIYENGVQKATSPILYNASDAYRVALESGSVKYYHNGTLIYTSSNSPTYPLLFDTALYARGGQIQNAVIASDPVSLPPPPEPQASCTFISAFFNYCSGNPPILGSPVHLVVTAQGCPPGYDVSFIIKEEDTGLGDDQRPGQLTAKFNSTGTSAQVLWTVDGDAWDDDSVGGAGVLVSPNYQFYFEASAVNPQTRINSYNSSSRYLQVPLNSKGGCINCAPILAPGICQCNDGSSFDRGYWGGIQGGNCRDIICQDHKGDALVDKCGGGGGIGPGQPGEDVPLKWGIFNPLKGMSPTQNVFDLVVIIADWILNIAGSLIIILIIYSGVRFLISRGNPSEIQKAKGILFWALVGFGVILIGKGFVYLIESVLRGEMPIF